MKTRVSRSLATAVVFVASIMSGTAHAQDLFVESDHTIANGDPINGTFDNILVGVDDETFEPVPDVDADFTGGSVSNTLELFSNSRASVSDGAVSAVFLHDEATFTFTGGTLDSLDANTDFGFGNGVVHFINGTITFGVLASGNSTIHVSGGTVGDRMFALQNSHYIFHGLSFSALEVGGFTSSRLSGLIYDITLVTENGPLNYRLVDINASTRPLSDFPNPGVQFSFQSTAAAPEPASLSLILAGLGSGRLIARRWRPSNGR